MTDPLSRVTSFTYDSAGRETTRTLPDGTQVATQYFADGNTKTRTVTIPGLTPQVTATTYDDQGRVKTTTEPGGRVTTFGYDALGRKTSELRTDSEIGPDGSEQPIQRLATWTYDELGRTVTETRPDGATITRTTDAAGNLVAYTDHDANTTTYAYTCLGQLERITYPDGTSRSFTYTDDGQLDTITRADGSVVQHDYDAPGRLERIHVTTLSPTLPPESHWSHDTHLTFDQLGQLTEAHNGAATVAFSYDSLGRQISESLTLDPTLVPGFGSKTVTRTLDDGGRPTVLALPSGASVTRAYSPGDALQSLSVGATSLWSAQLAGSIPTTITRGNGLVSTWTHSPALLPTQVDTTMPALPTHHHAYTWTAGQLRRGIDRTDTQSQLWRFHYDGAGHLETGNDHPAIQTTTPDVPLPPGTDPTTLRREDWQVNQVDELTSRHVTQDGKLETVTLSTNTLHQVTARRKQVGGSLELTTYTWTPDGALHTTQGPEGTTTLLHDWRDRLVQAQTPGAVTADLILDPLGRLVAKRTTTPEGTLHRAYLHDGDQVVEEYASVAGQTQVQLDRRHHWGRWIDDLVAEQVDTDHDGTLETTLYPVTDLLGSVEILTDETGRIVERITYDPDGTPHFWGEDSTRPQVTQVAWTGNGQSPTGVTVDANTLVVRFSEAIHEASIPSMTLTLTPDAGNHTEVLEPDGRTLKIAFEQPIPATTPPSLHLEGLKDRTGNLLFAFDASFTLGSGSSYVVLADATAPRLAAVIDTQTGFVLSFDEPVQPPQGTPLAGSVTVSRSGLPVSGTTSRLTETALAWTPAEPASWLPGGEYKVTALSLQDLAATPNPIQTAPLPLTLAHLATQPIDALLAYTEPTDSGPLAASQYGQTTLFQGREWHAGLGMSYFRARWYAPRVHSFSEPDALPLLASPSLYTPLSWSPFTVADPLGTTPTPPPPAPMPTPTPREARERDGLAPRPGPVPTPRPPAPSHPRLPFGERTVGVIGWVATELLHASSEMASASIDAQAEAILSAAERVNGMAGVSAEGQAVASMFGAHAGLNAEVFYSSDPAGQYTVGFFGFETVSSTIIGDEQAAHRRGLDLKPLQQMAGPMSTMGLAFGVSLGVNLAVASYPRYNSPEGWCGYFDTLSASYRYLGFSVFFSDYVVGVELSAGASPLPGSGAYTRPRTHALWTGQVDRGTAKALWKLYLQSLERT